ncbi:uncharacterized protein LOC143260611 [Megalopta genalis]|uniref:uncharacterized protein LOC143260611 n=1 Tax=Megalopta genalis TaxID=115081 RepID=UPI003FD6A659
MGYCASGDIRKTVHSSEDDEGYENQSFYSAVSFGVLNQPEIRNNSCFQFGKSVTISSELALPASDDSDKPFWAENELSSSESKQQLFKRQKRRRSLSYRNRLVKHRRKSVFFQSSSSSLDSNPGQITSKANRQHPAVQHIQYTFIFLSTVAI